MVQQPQQEEPGTPASTIMSAPPHVVKEEPLDSPPPATPPSTDTVVESLTKQVANLSVKSEGYTDKDDEMLKKCKSREAEEEWQKQQQQQRQQIAAKIEQDEQIQALAQISSQVDKLPEQNNDGAALPDQQDRVDNEAPDASPTSQIYEYHV